MGELTSSNGVKGSREDVLVMALTGAESEEARTLLGRDRW
jgi:hypothetical protein